MPGKNTPVQSAQKPTTSVSLETIKFAIAAVDVADIGLRCVADLRAIIRAIHNLAGDNETLLELAKVGLDLANERHILIDCEREDLQEMLDAMRGANHA